MLSYNVNNFANANSWNFSQDKRVKWTGWYEQNGQRTNMHFNHMAIKNGGVIFGQGQDQVGGFTISGNMVGNGTVNFNKQYHGKHSVQYSGQLNGNLIQGKWTIPGSCQGGFQLRMETEQWKGYYEQNG